jgi:hypothetical protein
MNPSHILLSYLRFILTLFSHLSLGLAGGRFPSGVYRQIVLCNSIRPYACNMLYQSYPPLLNY